MKMMPTIARIAKEFEFTENDSCGLIGRGLICIDKEFKKDVEPNFIFVTVFGSTAKYIRDYYKVGGRIFLRDWNVEQNKRDNKYFYDFSVRSLDIVDFKD